MSTKIIDSKTPEVRLLEFEVRGFAVLSFTGQPKLN